MTVKEDIEEQADDWNLSVNVEAKGEPGGEMDVYNVWTYADGERYGFELVIEADADELYGNKYFMLRSKIERIVRIVMADVTQQAP